ncbi:MFS general substrate transporter [Delitschia confertaspora ATCC 74209]|uniref:MFS general substrate transporter n=1 Tax=Delitschia confertaspora ATCC 74209 TaxID=1513339 RepID=A0A9P4JFR9_9PLEO|nr:MFS general substrate transporter [Delitschia confertaspora ATCC 74209]
MSRRLSRASYRLSQAAEYSGLNFTQISPIELSDPRPPLKNYSDIENQHLPNNGIVSENKPEGPKKEETAPNRGIKFYLIIFALNIAQVLVALEGTVTSTALPSIIAQLGGGASYVWTTSGYFLASTVLLPLYGQMADILGRRVLILFAVCMFMLGSGISGGAPNMGILILGRVIQGMGGGGISMLSNLIVSDLVPLRDRGQFMALVLIAMAVGSGMGPFVGGIIVQRASWRWVFYLNLPIGATALILLILFLRVKGPSEKTTWSKKLERVDLAGNTIFVIGVSLILVALAYAGTQWAWKSYNTIITLLFGFATMVVFVVYEGSSDCKHPTMPLRLFRNRTSAAAYAMTFIHSLLTILVLYYLPVYFQSVLLSSPTRSGVQMLPTVIVMIPCAAISGTLLSKIGRYKPFHLAGFTVVTIGLGCFLTLNDKSPTVAWIMVQIVVAVGFGFSFSTLLPAVQAYLDDKDTAAATATWGFLRQFGVVWGVSVPAAIFNSQIEHLLPRIPDSAVREALSRGAAYDHGTKEYIGRFENPLRGQIISMYVDSIKVVWIFATAVAGLGLLLVFLEKEISLRKDNEGEYGLVD